MSPEEKIAAAEKLIDEARAEFAAKKRNWPEKIEPGMVFSEPNGSANAWFAAGVGFICISGSCLGMRRETLPTDCHYIGKDCVSIHTDAHEPTGAELVGNMCQVGLHPISEPNDGIRCLVTSFDPIIGYRTKEGESMPWKYARLAR